MDHTKPSAGLLSLKIDSVNFLTEKIPEGVVPYVCLIKYLSEIGQPS